MRLEDAPRNGVETELVTGVLLTDGRWYPCEQGSFTLNSPVEPGHRNRQGSVFMLFYATDMQRWIEAPLGSMVAVSYPEPDSEADTPK